MLTRRFIASIALYASFDYGASMDLAQLRRLVIVAMFSDDVLFERLVLKGGNALRLVHGIGARASMDVDFSMEGDFEELDEIRGRVTRALSDRFDSAGYVAFDIEMEKRPSVDRDAGRWGGYRVEFKSIERTRFERYADDLEGMRRNALVVGREQIRTFGIDISKYECCDSKERAELDSYTIYVYSRSMIAIEKLRALCQQMSEYTHARTKSARAADFYDIHALVEQGVDIATAENQQLTRDVFAAKNVPVALLGRIRDQREFHRVDWPSVELTVTENLRGYDFYFDFVVSEVERLKTLWIE